MDVFPSMTRKTALRLRSRSMRHSPIPSALLELFQDCGVETLSPAKLQQIEDIHHLGRPIAKTDQVGHLPYRSAPLVQKILVGWRAEIEPGRNCRIGLQRVPCCLRGALDLRGKLEMLCRIVAAPRAMRLIKEMALAFGIAIGAEGIAKMTEYGLTLLGRSWPIH
jgi:hypothetical protein